MTNTNASVDSKNNSDEVHGYDVGKMGKWKCKPTEWIVEEIIAKNRLNFMAAASYTGKSLFSLYLSTKLVQGGKLFGKFQITPPKKILYIALEDPLQRIKERLTEVLQGTAVPKYRFYVWPVPYLNLAQPTLMEALELIISSRHFDFVIIDTYQRATPGLDSYKDEDHSEILHRLAYMTRSINTTILIIDHIRKTKNNQWSGKHPTMADIKGTAGKAQNSDSVILMSRKGNRLKISTHSKDADRQHLIELEVREKGAAGEKFVLIESGENNQRESESENIHRIKTEFQRRGVASVPDVAKSTGLSESTVRRVARELKKAGVLRQTTRGPKTKYEYVDQKEMVN